MRTLSLAWLELRRFFRGRLTTAAVVVLAVIPLLYGALYLAAFWDPYGRLNHIPAALVVVLIAGAVVHAPLSRVPENTLKFAVGVMLTTFGIFWSTEGDPPQTINDLSEITDAHIRAIEPPHNEQGWLDPIGWMGVYTARFIATTVQVV